MRPTAVGDHEEDHMQPQIDLVFRVESEFDAEELEQVEHHERHRDHAVQEDSG